MSSWLSRSTRVMRVRSIDTPPRTALTWPSSELPMPNGMIGAVVGGAGGDHAAHLVGARREDDRVGRRRGVPRLAVAVVFADGGGRGHPVAGHGPQVGDEGVEG